MQCQGLIMTHVLRRKALEGPHVRARGGLQEPSCARHESQSKPGIAIHKPTQLLRQQGSAHCLTPLAIRKASSQGSHCCFKLFAVPPRAVPSTCAPQDATQCLIIIKDTQTIVKLGPLPAIFACFGVKGAMPGKPGNLFALWTFPGLQFLRLEEFQGSRQGRLP